jgi:hypothetical protein
VREQVAEARLNGGYDVCARALDEVVERQRDAGRRVRVKVLAERVDEHEPQLVRWRHRGGAEEVASGKRVCLYGLQVRYGVRADAPMRRCARLAPASASVTACGSAKAASAARTPVVTQYRVMTRASAHFVWTGSGWGSSVQAATHSGESRLGEARALGGERGVQVVLGGGGARGSFDGADKGVVRGAECARRDKRHFHRGYSSQNIYSIRLYYLCST